MEALTAAFGQVLTFATTILSTCMGNPILALSFAFPFVAGGIGVLRRIV